MTQHVLRWLPGNGWLVFSGGDDGRGAIRSEALARALVDGGAAYFSFAEDGGDALIEDMDDLGAPAGYLLDPRSEDAESIQALVQEASIIVLEAGERIDDLLRNLQEPAQIALQTAYERGAVLLFEGLAINLLGRWSLSDSGDLFEGWHWLQDAFLEPGAQGMDSSLAVQRILSLEAEAVAISVGTGSALALGPQGRIELWGERQVTVSLGRAYHDALNQEDGEQN